MCVCVCVCVCVFTSLFVLCLQSFFFSFLTIQILTLYDELAVIDVEAVVRYVSSLQQADGSFIGNKWGK